MSLPGGRGNRKSPRNIDRWALQRAARAALSVGLPPGEKSFGIDYCHRTWIHGVRDVQVRRNRVDGSFSYGGVVRCGSPWSCPVCSSFISRRRAKELVRAIEGWAAGGGRVYLLTITIRHGVGDNLGDLLTRFRGACRVMKNRVGWRRFKTRIGLAGSVYSLEVTHGCRHGWHPHEHVVLFCRADGEEPDEGVLLGLWTSAAQAVGLDCNHHGIRIHDGRKAGLYASKFGDGAVRTEGGWSLGYELTRSHSKHGKRGNRTPWDLLRLVAATGDPSASMLFRSFALAFRGRRQMVWDRGLRSLLNLGAEKSDLADAHGDPGDVDVIYSLSTREWSWVVMNDFQGEVLRVARASGAVGIRHFLRPARDRDSPSHEEAA